MAEELLADRDSPPGCRGLDLSDAPTLDDALRGAEALILVWNLLGEQEDRLENEETRWARRDLEVTSSPSLPPVMVAVDIEED